MCFQVLAFFQKKSKSFISIGKTTFHTCISFCRHIKEIKYWFWLSVWISSTIQGPYQLQGLLIVINLVMDYLICLHVCHNYVNIILHSTASCGTRMLIFFFFNIISGQRIRKAGKSMQLLDVVGWSRPGTLTFLRLPASKQEHSKNSKQHWNGTYYANLIICIL